MMTKESRFTRRQRPGVQATSLTAKTVPAHLLGEDVTNRMFELMRKYYEGISREQFLADLAKKDDVILLFDSAGNRLQGFSTLVTVRVRQGRREHHGIFSGDTVIEKPFWGQRALGKAFLRYLFGKKLRRPFQPLYWLLISKGYKTYLMMANNFGEYYPRYDRPTPAPRKILMDAFYGALYPYEYRAGQGVIEPAMKASHLKTGVAPISRQLLAENPKIAFFQRANPDWQKGAELACLARMTLRMPFQYALKTFVVDCLIEPLRSFQASVFSSLLRKENRKR